MTSQLNQIYSESVGLPLRFDFFRPPNEDVVPLVICIHGGGWISGEKEGMHPLAHTLTANGYAVACPQYRLAPLHPYPAAVEDIQEFVRHMRAHAAKFKIHPNRIASLGNSAGGHLAAMAGLTGDERVNVVVDICGIVDLTDPRAKHYPISWAFLDQFMPLPYEGNEKTFEEASPLYHVTKEAPPFLIIHGDADDIVPVEQSEIFAQKLTEAGVPNQLHIITGEGHSFTFEGWLHVERLFLEFLDSYLKDAV